MTVTACLDHLVRLLLPAPCLGCGELLPGRRHPLGLCAPCRNRLARLPGIAAAACARCARPVAGTALPAGWRCGACRAREPSFDRLLAAWTYAPPLDQVVRALKFRRLDYLGRQLGTALADAVADEVAAELAGAAAVVPMPLAWRRRLARGYNQAELLARPLARRLDLPLARPLHRRRSASPQSSLDRRRRSANLRGSFRCRRRPPRGTLLLVDDVVTTGATLEEAAACLKRAGAERVVAVVAARTPLWGER